MLSAASSLIPLVGGLVALLLSPVSLVLWIVLMVKAVQEGPRLELPIVGEWAAEQAEI